MDKVRQHFIKRLRDHDQILTTDELARYAKSRNLVVSRKVLRTIRNMWLPYAMRRSQPSVKEFQTIQVGSPDREMVFPC